MVNQLVEFDRTFSLWVHAHSRPWLDKLMLTVTYGGDWRFLLLFTLASMTFLFFWHRSQRAARLLPLAYGLSYLANPLLKTIFQRRRPELWEVAARPSSYSFPSGHALSSMLVYGVAAFLFAQTFPRQRRGWVGGAALWILLIGFSRIYLGVHWLSDVVAGFALGGALVYALVRWDKLSKRAANSSAPHSPLR
jgi:undecaprenyl-diphosphatase